jgi:pyrimidine operon attenuation protein/uracil phosphoribosyltransferase
MEEKIKAKIMDGEKMKRTFSRIAMEILEKNKSAEIGFNWNSNKRSLCSKKN